MLFKNRVPQLQVQFHRFFKSTSSSVWLPPKMLNVRERCRFQNTSTITNDYHANVLYDTAKQLGIFAIHHHNNGNSDISQSLLDRALDILNKLPTKNEKTDQLKQNLIEEKQKIVEDTMRWSRSTL